MSGTSFPLVNANKKEVNLEGNYLGASAFLIGAGPSLSAIDCTRLQERGIFTCAINNVAANIIKPNMWVHGDPPQKFCMNIWEDPTILKFTRNTYFDKPLRYKVGERTKFSAYKVSDMPNVLGYVLSTGWSTATWLQEPVCTWGNSSGEVGQDGIKGQRSTMLIALKLLYVLGFRKVYLLGADFNMKAEEPYCFDQKKSAGACSSNNLIYKALEKRFKLLEEPFAQAGFSIVNCTEGSKLKAFPFEPLEEVLEKFKEKQRFKNLTKGMYEKSSRKQAIKIQNPKDRKRTRIFKRRVK